MNQIALSWLRLTYISCAFLSMLLLAPSSTAQVRNSENYQLLSDSLSVAAGSTVSTSYKLYSIVGSGYQSGQISSTNFDLRAGSIAVVSVTDQDNDSVLNQNDNCTAVFNPTQQNTDNDPQGDACDEDDDGDGVVDALDNCQFTINANQTDTDQNGFGNACDLDDDGDTIDDSIDNCPVHINPEQIDTNDNGIGDACEDNELCIPIASQNNRIALICL